MLYLTLSNLYSVFSKGVTEAGGSEARVRGHFKVRVSSLYSVIYFKIKPTVVYCYVKVGKVINILVLVFCMLTKLVHLT